VFVKARYGIYPLYVEAGKTVDVGVYVWNREEAPATPGTIRIFFSSNASASVQDGSMPPGYGVCGTAAATASFTPPATAIKQNSRVLFTVPGVPIPALAPGKWKAFVMIEPGEPRARARPRARPARGAIGAGAGPAGNDVAARSGGSALRAHPDSPGPLAHNCVQSAAPLAKCWSTACWAMHSRFMVSASPRWSRRWHRSLRRMGPGRGPSAGPDLGRPRARARAPREPPPHSPTAASPRRAPRRRPSPPPPDPPPLLSRSRAVTNGAAPAVDDGAGYPNKVSADKKTATFTITLFSVGTVPATLGDVSLVVYDRNATNITEGFDVAALKCTLPAPLAPRKSIKVVFKGVPLPPPRFENGFTATPWALLVIDSACKSSPPIAQFRPVRFVNLFY
jgi:hypothetical protein